MVKIDDHLVRLGGAQQSFDHLNAGPALEYLKSTKLNKVSSFLDNFSFKIMLQRLMMSCCWTGPIPFALWHSLATCITA